MQKSLKGSQMDAYLLGPPCLVVLSKSFLVKYCTPAWTLFISGLKSRVLKLPFLLKNYGKKWFRLFILKFTEPLQSCCFPVQKYLPRMAELAWQLSRYLWRGLVNFKINSRPLFTIIFKLKNDNFMTRDFSPLIEWVCMSLLF